MNYSSNRQDRGYDGNDAVNTGASSDRSGYQQMHFSTQLGGYSRAEVDAFSRTVQSDLDVARAEKKTAEDFRKRAEASVYKLQDQLDDLKAKYRIAVLDFPPEEVMKNLPERERMSLAQAHERNQHILSNANRQAEGIVADAQAVLRDAERKREQMLAECAREIEAMKEEQRAREESWEAHRQRQEGELKRKVADGRTYCDKLLADTRAEAHSILEEAKAKRDQEDSDFAINMQAKRRSHDENLAALRAEGERQYNARIDAANDYVARVEAAGAKVQSAFDQAARTMSDAVAQAAALPSFKTLEPNLPVFAEDEEDEELL